MLKISLTFRGEKTLDPGTLHPDQEDKVITQDNLHAKCKHSEVVKQDNLPAKSDTS